MLVAVFSDIHANRHAFEAVLDAAAAAGVDEHWCLGDVVGYGGEPDACVALAGEHCDVLLAGNHDLAVMGELAMDDFSLTARQSAEWTRDTLDAASRDRLAGLPSAGTRAGIGLFHGSPRHPVWEYVISETLAELCLDAAEQPLNLVGHSHVAIAFGRAPGARTVGTLRRDGDAIDLWAGEWLLNPGSVGQPRDGDPRAAWLQLDTAAGTATWHRSTYDIAGAQTAIRAAGLPDTLAERLQYGQ